ncbi:hypothetical protein J6590_047337 [Homalodisca vitripennis]|nr:hypothetical protein J6590_047337 [Homalodisca vitripennis]
MHICSTAIEHSNPLSHHSFTHHVFPIVPLSTNNSRQSQHQNNGRKYPQGSPKQKSGARRGGNMTGGFPPHHPMQSWYNIISPPWMSPSPPPYHPMMRRQGGPLPPHHHHARYHWSNKSMLKV